MPESMRYQCETGMSFRISLHLLRVDMRLVNVGGDDGEANLWQHAC